MDSYQSEDTDKLSPREAHFFKIFGRWFLRVGGTIIVLLFLTMAVLLGRLAYGPIKLGFIRSDVEHALNKAELGIDVHFGDIEMVWERWLRPYEIVIKDIEISDPSVTPDTIHIPEVGLSIWIEKLLAGQIVIRNLFIYTPQFVLNRNPETGFALKFGADGESKAFSFEDIEQFLVLGRGEQSLGSLSHLNKIVITDANVILHDDENGEVWKLPRTTFILNRYSEGFRLRASLKSSRSKLFARSVEMELKHRSGSSRMDLAVDFKKANFAEMISAHNPLILNDPTNTSSLEKALEALCGLDFPIKGPIHFAIVPQTGQLIEGEILLQAGAGTLSLFGERIPLNDFSTFANIDHSVIKVDRFKLQFAESQITAKAVHQAVGVTPLHIHRWFEPESKLAINIEGANLNIQTLGKLWPKSLASEAREWVTNEIKEGLIPKLQFDFDSHVDEASGFLIDVLNGKFNIDSARINYLEGLPHAQRITGTAEFDHQGFDIDIKEGNVQGVEVTAGKVLIKGLDTDNESLELDFQLRGPVDDLLSIIDNEPLGYAREASLDPAKTKGDGEYKINMSFPLIKDLSFDDIKLGLQGDVRSVSTSLDFGSKHLDISEANLQLHGDENHLSAKGQAVINELSSQVETLIYFNDKKPGKWSAQVVVDTVATDKDFKKEGYDYTEYVKGRANSKFVFQSYGKGRSTLGVNLGLKNMRIDVPQIGWSKSINKPASLSFVVHIGEEGAKNIQEISLQSDYISAKGNASFDDKHEMSAISLSSVQAPSTSADISVLFNKEGGYDLHFEGKRVNAEPFMKFLNNGQPGKRRSASFPLNITSNVNYLRMKEGAEFKDVNSTVRLIIEPDDVKWIQVRLSASAGGGVSSRGRMGREAGGISFDIEPDGKNGQTLEIFANDAGQLFKNLDIYDNVLGGQMKVQASREGDQPFQGEFEINNFNAERIPLVGRLASILSPMGIMNLFSDNGQVTIREFSCDFTFSEEEVKFTSGVGKSIGLGFTADGSMDRVNRRFDIKGNLIPAYILNSILDNIPIVGSLLTGGKGEGLFAAGYTVTGSMDDPNISVNPLTALAPGFIRNLFNE